jgi:hypothetical protein
VVGYNFQCCIVRLWICSLQLAVPEAVCTAWILVSSWLIGRRSACLPPVNSEMHKREWHGVYGEVCQLRHGSRCPE